MSCSPLSQTQVDRAILPGKFVLPAPDGTFIHPRAAEPTKLCSSERNSSTAWEGVRVQFHVDTARLATLSAAVPLAARRRGEEGTRGCALRAMLETSPAPSRGRRCLHDVAAIFSRRASHSSEVSGEPRGRTNATTRVQTCALSRDRQQACPHRRNAHPRPPQHTAGDPGRDRPSDRGVGDRPGRQLRGPDQRGRSRPAVSVAGGASRGRRLVGLVEQRTGKRGVRPPLGEFVHRRGRALLGEYSDRRTAETCIGHEAAFPALNSSVVPRLRCIDSSTSRPTN